MWWEVERGTEEDVVERCEPSALLGRVVPSRMSLRNMR